jgi:hypothetical protein
MNNEMIIVIDTSEQKPYFSGRTAPKGILVVRDNLKDQGGDYSLRGYEDQIIIERKSPEDFLSSCFNDRNRFFSTFPKLRDHQVKFIVVECSFTQLLSMCGGAQANYKKGFPLSPVRRSKKRAISVEACKETVWGIQGRRQIPIIFCEQGRRQAEAEVFGILKAFYKGIREGI